MIKFASWAMLVLGLACTKQPNTITQLISAGNYTYVSPYITDEHFPITTAGHSAEKFRIIPQTELFGGNGKMAYGIDREDVVARFKELGLRLPTMQEVLTIAAKDNEVGTPFCFTFIQDTDFYVLIKTVDGKRSLVLGRPGIIAASVSLLGIHHEPEQ